MRISKKAILLVVFALAVMAFLITLGAANALYRPAERQPVNYIGDGAMDDYSDEMISEADENADAFISRKCDRNFFNCRLMKEILKTHRFLQRNENGLPYTKDSRDLTPLSEEIRLVVDTQANGYLNLYKITGKKKYLREAESRLNYILSVQNNFTLDGQVGYTFLSAYESNHNPAYLKLGLKIAEQCIAVPEKDKILNWGLMCAMDLAKAYRITGNSTYLNEARKFVRNTMTQQYADGSFPHQITKGPNAPYTSWMVYELNQVRADDPRNPDIEVVLIKANGFLVNRINQNGSLNYQDENGSYYYDADPNAETRGWNNELAYFGYDLRTMGENEKAEKILRFLFQQENTRDNSGSYPDKWGYPESSVWANGNPSVVRTSIIFWMLTSIPLIGNSCQNGLVLPCTITPSDCNSAFRELNYCNAGLTGSNVCINGMFTGCLNKNLIYYKSIICNKEIIFCDPSRPECAIMRNTYGYEKCIGDGCTACFYNVEIENEEVCSQDPFC